MGEVVLHLQCNCSGGNKLSEAYINLNTSARYFNGNPQDKFCKYITKICHKSEAN